MVKTYKDYLNAVADDYPDIDRRVIDKVLKLGLKNYQGIISRDFDIRIACDGEVNHYQMMTVNTQCKTQKGINTRAKKLKIQLEKLRSKWIK